MQALRKLGEKTAIVRCRQVDLILVKEIMDSARKNYQALFQEEAPALTLDQQTFLPPPPSGNEELASWCATCMQFFFSS